MVAVFAFVVLTGSVIILVGWNYAGSGRIKNDADAHSQISAQFRSVGRLFVNVGQVLLLIGLVGMAISALTLLI